MTDPHAVNILIVDDAFPVREMIKYMLRKAGFETFSEAANGEEAFSILKDGAIDLVIADWKMPRLSGLALLEKIRADDQLKALPFIMVTGEGDKEQVTTAILAGASDYVLKPVSADILQKKVRRLVEQPAAPPPARGDDAPN